MTCTTRAMDGAAGGGHLEMLQWLAENRGEGCSSAAFGMAAAAGHLNVIEVTVRRHVMLLARFAERDVLRDLSRW